MKKQVSKRTKILLLSIGFIVILGGGLWFYFSRIKADEIMDGIINSKCSSGVVLPARDTTAAKEALKRYSGVDYPESDTTEKTTTNKSGPPGRRSTGQTTTSTAEFTVDLDTYASTWSNQSQATILSDRESTVDTKIDDYLTKDKIGTDDGDGEIIPPVDSENYESQRLELKQKLPQIIEEIKKVYGDPWNGNRVLVAYIPDWQYDPDLNQYGMNNVTDLYRDDLNMIFLSQFAFDSNGKLNLDEFIHELTHAFNDGNIPIDSYEEGLVGATTSIVMKKFDPNYSTSFADTSNRTILSATAGLIRTFQDGSLVSDRYQASAKFFYDQVQANPNFIKDYRKRFKASKWYTKISPDPTLFMQKQVVEGACDELTRHYSEFEEFLHDMENLLVPTLGVTNGKKNSQATTLQKQYPIILLMPESKVYLEVQNIPSDPSLVHIISSYKINNIQNLIPSFYETVNGNIPPNHMGLTDLSKVFDNASGASLTSLQDAAYYLDQYVDAMTIELYNGNSKLISKDIPVNYNSYNIYLNDIIAQSKSPKINGNVKLVITTSKLVLKGETAKHCYSLVIGQTCRSDGLYTKSETLKSQSVTNMLTIKNGKVIGFNATDSNTKLLNQSQNVQAQFVQNDGQEKAATPSNKNQ